MPPQKTKSALGAILKAFLILLIACAVAFVTLVFTTDGAIYEKVGTPRVKLEAAVTKSNLDFFRMNSTLYHDMNDLEGKGYSGLCARVKSTDMVCNDSVEAWAMSRKVTHFWYICADSVMKSTVNSNTPLGEGSTSCRATD